MRYCVKCGYKLNIEDGFCPKCGNKVATENCLDINEDKKQIEEKRNAGAQSNKGIKLLFLAIATQAISLICSFQPGRLGGIMFFVFLVSIVFVFISSVICIKKSKAVEKHKGKALGIVFSILSGVVIIIVLLSLIFGEKAEIEQGIEDAAHAAVGTLYASLKNPGSMQVNVIKAEVDYAKTRIIIDGVLQNADEPFDGFYTIYIDYSATNGFGGTTRSCIYFKYDENYILVAHGEIGAMPTETNGTLYTLNADYYNSANYSDFLK